MNKDLALTVAGIIFTIVAIIHLLRLIYGIQVTFGDHTISMGLSVFGLIISSALAIWMFMTRGSKS